MVSTKTCDGSSQNLMFWDALSLLWSFEGGRNRFLKLIVTLWGTGSPFYSKWAGMQWKHSSSVRATKCKVCQHAGRLWHMYSVLQEWCTVMQPHTVYNKHKELLQSCYWELEENPTCSADTAHCTVIFGPVKLHLGGHQFYSNKNGEAWFQPW
jgi:hypothetical protein